MFSKIARQFVVIVIALSMAMGLVGIQAQTVRAESLKTMTCRKIKLIDQIYWDPCQMAGMGMIAIVGQPTLSGAGYDQFSIAAAGGTLLGTIAGTSYYAFRNEELPGNVTAEAVVSNKTAMAKFFIKIVGDALLNSKTIQVGGQAIKVSDLKVEGLFQDPSDEALQSSIRVINSDGTVTALPQLTDEDLGHAARSRAMNTTACIITKLQKDSRFVTGLFKVRLCYEYVRDNIAEVYFSPTAMTLVGIAHEEGVGYIAVIFNAQGSGTMLSYGNFRTLVVGGVNKNRLLLSSCASVKVWPLPPSYDSTKEPPPIGQGTCLKNGNVND